MRLATIASHPIQYHAPLFRELARRFEQTVFFAHQATAVDQARAGFGVEFAWDIDLLSGYDHVFMRNVAKPPGLDRFSGCDAPEIGRQLDRCRFDAVLVQGWHLKAYCQAIFAAKTRGIPVLVRGDSQMRTPRSGLKKAVKSLAYPALLRFADRALYVGQRSYEYWLHYKYPAQRMFFSPHCVDVGWFSKRATASARAAVRSRLNVSEETKVVLFAGKLVEFKRPLDVIGAVARLRAEGRNIRIAVAGAGCLEARMKQEAELRAVPVDFLGFCNQTEMPSVYAAADVLVLPSDGTETWGLVANEALASGTPIVLSDMVGSAPDLAADGRVGAMFRMGDIEGLAGAIARVLAERPSAAAIAAKSNTYSVTAAADGVEAALSELAESRR